MTYTMASTPETFFEYDLSLELKIEAGGANVSILSGNIEDLSLDLHSYGFTCMLQFSSFENNDLDDLFSPSNVPKVTKASLSFKSTEKDQPDPLLELRGIVTKKIVKRVDQIGEKEQSVRFYEITFSDNAKVQWGEHFPVNIYIDQSMKHVIEQHKTPEISIDFNFPPLEEIHPILAFSLPYKHGEAPSRQTTFYSFLMWYLQNENAVWAYDYHSQSYSLSSTKESEGDPYKIFEPYVVSPTYIFPETLRYNVKTIKHSSTLADVEDLLVTDAFETIHRDVIVPLSPVDFLDLDHQEVKSSVNSEEAEIRLEVSQFLKEFHIDKLVPGSLVAFRGDAKIDSWTSDPFYKGKTFRSRELRVEAHKPKTSEAVVTAVESYRLSVTALLEEKDENFIERPDFIPPAFPFSIHGTVFSDIGDVPQTTYRITPAEESPQLYYLITVPLAGETKELIVPFTPDFMTGQYYFPFCKGEKVVLSVYFQAAKIERVLDWQPLARLPQGVQGNQIVLASNGQNKYSILRHEFEDLTNSVITLEQSSSATQRQTIHIQEKDLVITVEEQGKKTILVSLNNDSGLILSLQDKESGMTQTIVLDGKTITQTCKNQEATSTIVQKPDSVTVTCKTFTVTADNIALHAKDGIEEKGGSKVDIITPVTNIQCPSVKMG